MNSDVICVDKDDNEIGKMPMIEAHQKNVLHRIVVIYVTNNEGQILIQERRDNGKLDHSSAGHVDPGETYYEAAKRELFEELGIKDIDLKEIGYSVSGGPDGFGSHAYHRYKCYMCRATPGILDPEEVKSVYWADPKEILKDMESDGAHKYTAGFKDSLKIYLASDREHPSS